MRRTLALHLPTALWGGFVAAALLAPGSDAPPPAWLAWLEAPGADKLVHGALFCVQAWLLGRSLEAGRRPGRAWAAGVAAAAYGLLLEAAQTGVAGRGFELGDLLANCVGAAIGALAGARARRR